MRAASAACRWTLTSSRLVRTRRMLSLTERATSSAVLCRVETAFLCSSLLRIHSACLLTVAQRVLEGQTHGVADVVATFDLLVGLGCSRARPRALVEPTRSSRGIFWLRATRTLICGHLDAKLGPLHDGVLSHRRGQGSIRCRRQLGQLLRRLRLRGRHDLQLAGRIDPRIGDQTRQGVLDIHDPFSQLQQASPGGSGRTPGPA